MSIKVKCDHCGDKDAEVHITKNLNGKETELNLCNECAKSVDVFDTKKGNCEISVKNLLGGILSLNNTNEADAKEVCSACSFSFSDFKRIGRLACSHCYTSFEDKLEGILKKIHGKSSHTGRKPKYIVKLADNLESVKKLEVLLCDALKNEDYEKAASIRDDIRKLKEGEDV
jgi:protein arginine kinase activator